MPVASLLAASAVQAVTGLSFLAVGERFRRRAVSRPGLLAARAFVAFWWSMGAFMLMEAATGTAAGLGAPSFAADLAVRLASGPVLALAAGGLAFYVLFLFSGRRGLAVPVAVYYGLAGGLYSFNVWAHGPTGVDVGAWSQGLAYERPLDGDPVWSLVLTSFGVPLVLGSLAYLALLRRAKGRAQRYRIAMVACSLLAWVVAGYVGQVAAGDLVQFVTLVPVGLATSLAVVVAYFPPRPVRAWLERGTRGAA